MSISNSGSGSGSREGPFQPASAPRLDQPKQNGQQKSSAVQGTPGLMRSGKNLQKKSSPTSTKPDLVEVLAKRYLGTCNANLVRQRPPTRLSTFLLLPSSGAIKYPVPSFLFHPPNKLTAVLAGTVSQFLDTARPTDAPLLCPATAVAVAICCYAASPIYKQTQGLKRFPRPASHALALPCPARPMFQQMVLVAFWFEMPVVGVIVFSPELVLADPMMTMMGACCLHCHRRCTGAKR